MRERVRNIRTRTVKVSVTQIKKSATPSME
jgi:hypothetical protein